MSFFSYALTIRFCYSPTIGFFARSQDSEDLYSEFASGLLTPCRIFFAPISFSVFINFRNHNDWLGTVWLDFGSGALILFLLPFFDCFIQFGLVNNFSRIIFRRLFFSVFLHFNGPFSFEKFRITVFIAIVFACFYLVQPASLCSDKWSVIYLAIA